MIKNIQIELLHDSDLYQCGVCGEWREKLARAEKIDVCAYCLMAMLRIIPPDPSIDRELLKNLTIANIDALRTVLKKASVWNVEALEALTQAKFWVEKL